MMELAAVVIALLFAANIGASGAAAAIGHVYGTGALRRTVALALVGVAALLGAVLAGGEVTRTISDGLVPQHELTLALVLVALVSATLPLALANILGIPLSTSEVTVGAVVGVGVALGAVNYSLLGLIVATWVILPVAALAVASAATWTLYRFSRKEWDPTRSRPAVRRLLLALLVAGGVYIAFSAGANNTANAVGPLVAGGILEPTGGLLLGGLVLAGGAMLLGHRVLETNGKRIVHLNPATGSVVGFTTGTLVLGASFLGIPVPLTQATSGAILGVGFGRSGVRALNKQVVRDIATVWIVSPVVSFLMAYCLAHEVQGRSALTQPTSYVLLLIGMAAIIATLALLNRPRLLHSYSVLRSAAGHAKRLALLLLNVGGFAR